MCIDYACSIKRGSRNIFNTTLVQTIYMASIFCFVSLTSFGCPLIFIQFLILKAFTPDVEQIKDTKMRNVRIPIKTFRTCSKTNLQLKHGNLWHFGKKKKTEQKLPNQPNWLTTLHHCCSYNVHFSFVKEHLLQGETADDFVSRCCSGCSPEIVCLKIHKKSGSLCQAWYSHSVWKLSQSVQKMFFSHANYCH